MPAAAHRCSWHRAPRPQSHLKSNARHKHLIFVLNKCDLVPPWITKKWVAILSKVRRRSRGGGIVLRCTRLRAHAHTRARGAQEHPTLAFHASLTKPFGQARWLWLLLVPLRAG
jgi:nuclear GTP-binding protein